MVDDRTPVLIGVAQRSVHVEADEVGRVGEPALMTAAALRDAEVDSGGRDVLRRATGLWVVDPLCWRYRDPTEPVASALGIDPAHRLRSGVGGETPLTMVNRAAEAIAAGEHDIVLVAGAELMRSRKLARSRDISLGWTRQPDSTPEPEMLAAGSPFVSADPVHPAERAVGLKPPVSYYPLFENALRAKTRRTIEEHTAALGRLWSRFSEVAATNPDAWRPTVYSPEDITTVGPDNRMIGFPYPKLMNADMGVDMAAAVIVSSVGAARAAGVPPERWVYLWSGASSHDHWHVGERVDLAESPSIAANGRAVLASAGVAVEDVAHLDLYSCFPSAVQVGASALGLPMDDPDRPLTVTGGLTFAGGPGSNYVTHSLATMVGRLRTEPDTTGLVTGNGWFLTKHSMALLSARAPTAPFRYLDPQPEVDALPKVEIALSFHGPATLETYTVLHARDGGPEFAVLACRTPDGHRVWARSESTDLLPELMTTELIGTKVTVDSSGPHPVVTA
ncbi:acetyl-CoA acetyltransferase [Pseudonocardia spinosispora]|uniref:acetyl-CoA acetyltransferase n=1 Tax=Pseudonocardia spinosispora TaxID=103441 RepID=UPI0004274E27|nr:acetyl-CoA acetyltransferase [Pseudonocardia spinosispora]